MSTSHTPSITRVFYSTTECTKILGISKKTMYKLLKSGKLPHIRTGRLIRVNINDLRALSYSYAAAEAAKQAAAAQAAETPEAGDDE